MCFVLDVPKMTYFKSKHVAYLEEYAILSNKKSCVYSNTDFIYLHHWHNWMLHVEMFPSVSVFAVIITPAVFHICTHFIHLQSTVRMLGR
jgi:hypothetical protein